MTSPFRPTPPRSGAPTGAPFASPDPSAYAPDDADAPAQPVPGLDTPHGADLPEFDETHAFADAFTAGAREGFDLPPEAAEALDVPEEAAEGERDDEDEAPPAGPTPEQQRRALMALYGADCPLGVPGEVPDAAWVRWAQGLWERHRASMQPMLRAAARNRLFRQGRQWVSWRGGEWREPPAARDEARIVHNLVRAALALRQQVVSEQRPGFRMTPAQQTPGSEKMAEAQQRALEYQYDQQTLSAVIREAAHWAGTDGVAFLYAYYDDQAGPWDEERPQPLGDLRTCVFRIEQVRVSANATAHQAPDYWVVRTVLPLSEAVARHGARVAGTRDVGLETLDALSMPSQAGAMLPAGDMRQGQSPTQLLAEQETVDQFLVFCRPVPGLLPQGLALVVVGDVVVQASPLPWGVVPLVRFADGSEDPAFFPAPAMDDWVDHQRRINALLSKAIENVRINGTGRLLTRPGAIKQETLIGGALSLIEVGAGVALSEAVQPLPPFSIAGDVLELYQLEVQAFEQKSGWNDTTRGSFGSDQSGRAILAARESVERIFTPAVTAASEAMEAWAKITCHGMRHHYDLPRTIGATGGNRPDLALAISSDDFAGIGEVRVEPETLMPMPRSLRLFLLDSMFEKGVMTPQEYRSRLPFAYTGSIQTPNARQEARGRRVALALKQGAPPPELRWTDDEGIHQTVLEEDILSQDDPTNPQWAAVVQQATARWAQLATQAAMKQGAAPPMPDAAPGGPGDGAPEGTPLPPQQQPFLGTNPGVAAGPIAAMTGQGGDEAAAQAFDGMQGA